MVDRCASYELDGDARHRQGFYLDLPREGVIPMSYV